MEGWGHTGEGLAPLPVCCHPALHCPEFRLEHAWGRQAEQGTALGQLLLLLHHPALLKPLDLSSEPLAVSSGNCWPGCSKGASLAIPSTDGTLGSGLCCPFITHRAAAAELCPQLLCQGRERLSRAHPLGCRERSQHPSLALRILQEWPSLPCPVCLSLQIFLGTHSFVCLC